MKKQLAGNRLLILFMTILLGISLGLFSTSVYAQEPLKIALIAPLTGAVGALGQAELSGAKVAEKHINEDGGILGRKIVIVERDTAASPATGVKVVRELAMNENVKFYVGLVSSAVALATMPLMEEFDSILITCAPGTQKITGVNCSPHTFRISINSWAQNRAAAKLAMDKFPQVKRWAGINPDYEFGHMCWESFTKELKRLKPDVELVEAVWPKFMTKTFEPEILKILQAKPEGIYCSLYSGEFVTFVKQAQKYRFFDSLKVFIDPHIETDVANLLGTDMPDVWVSGTHYNYMAFNNPLDKRFKEDHKKLFGTFPVFSSSEAYTAIYALKYAMEKGKTVETKAVIKNLRGLTFETVTGKRYIRPQDHQTVKYDVALHFKPTKEPPGWKMEDMGLVWSEPFIPRLDEPEGGCKMKW
jgi:branched-chain amino acid transport system substrate-binding protein